MDREEINKTESGTKKQPVHRRPRRTDGSASRKTEGDAVRRRKSAAGRKSSSAAEELRKNDERKAEQTERPKQMEKPEQMRKRRSSGRQGERMSAKKRQQKRTRFNIVSSVILVAAVCVFIFSLYQLVMMLIPYYSGSKIYDEIKDIAITADEDGSGFKVDFDALMRENSDTVAWIRFDEPSIISYPVVKSADNVEYLTRTFTANDNKLGAIFMDMRNNSYLSDRNTIIYGHHLNVSPEMFSRLHLYEDEEFCREHPNFYIYTPDGSVRTYTVFSAGIVNAAANNYDVEFASDEEFEQYIELCRESSNYQVDVEVNAQSQILSLSTCTGDQRDERFLLQGVLTAVD